MKQVYLETFGCQMNVADTDRMEMLLFQSGYMRTSSPGDADLILLNTCSVREKAEQKIHSLLGNLKPLKAANPDLILGLAGCLAQQEGDNLARRFPYLDLILGPDTIENISAAVLQARSGGGPVVWTEFDQGKNYSLPAIGGAVDRPSAPSAFVNIIKGCDKFCSFCVVPLTRGREKSREADEICREALDLTRRGAREIILLGQNVNSYGKRGLLRPTAFHELLYQVAAVPGVRRLRFTTSYPRDFTPEMIRAFREIGALANHLHLPVQSGNDRVLELMRRGHTADEYLRLIDALRAEVPDISLSSDIIVGFPGETDAEFQDTVRLMERVGFDNSYMFAYSPRPGTPAELFPDTVPEAVKQERLQTVIERQRAITHANGEKYVGRIAEVLIEDRTTRNGMEFKGRNPHYWMVNFAAGGAALQPGDIVPVKIRERRGHVLIGDYAPAERRTGLC